METRGKLLASTKSQAAGRKAVILVSSIILYALAVLLLVNQDGFADMGRDLFHSVKTGQMVGWIAVCFLIAWPTFQLIMAGKGSKSYCEVYEGGVEGITCLNASKPDVSMQRFELSYHQILNVTATAKTIVIHTDHGSFEVLALKNQEAAARAIRARMSGNSVKEREHDHESV